MSNERVISKVKKLLALHNNNTSVNEASSAYKVAQKLLAEHRLTMADVQAVSTEEEIKEWGGHPLYEGKRRITWKCNLATTITRNNGCDALFYGGTILVVGRKSDFEIVQWLYDSISNQIEAMAKSACKGLGKGYSNDFKLGAARRVRERMIEAQAETKEKYAGTQALVLVNQKDEEVSHFVKKVLNPGNYIPARAKRASAYQKGQAAGNRVTLAKGGLKADNTNKTTNLLN